MKKRAKGITENAVYLLLSQFRARKYPKSSENTIERALNIVDEGTRSLHLHYQKKLQEILKQYPIRPLVEVIEETVMYHLF